MVFLMVFTPMDSNCLESPILWMSPYSSSTETCTCHTSCPAGLAEYHSCTSEVISAQLFSRIPSGFFPPQPAARAKSLPVPRGVTPTYNCFCTSMPTLSASVTPHMMVPSPPPTIMRTGVVLRATVFFSSRKPGFLPVSPSSRLKIRRLAVPPSLRGTRKGCGTCRKTWPLFPPLLGLTKRKISLPTCMAARERRPSAIL
mmetsp:Transcript_50830/g.134309  ORF Transcript_50830/g.134309 Transcript_50830/m.134309 type:complete len:200 (-) Transcript_50830:40-639(-)